ncbi:hypothetical protein [Bosea sp. Root670]|uniref:hypothetical protein n=1 Tax=Bosea sp. Root670 TaxID=1736583 RepID=UPI000782D6B3|nr:hypothetical protein [Bosea sp. Root670]
MIRSVLWIERVRPRPGGPEHPHQTKRGFRLADPKHGNRQHVTANAVYVETLEEAAALIERGFWIWMSQPGKRPSLISPDAVWVEYARQQKSPASRS